MEQFDGIMKLVGAELDAINRNGKFRSREEIDSVYKLIDIAKDIACIDKWEEESYNDSSYNDGHSYRDGSYEDGYGGRSYARGRGRNARRDSRGRYSGEGGSYRGGSYRGNGYSRDDGKQEYIENLRDMMEDAPDETTRQSIQRMIQQMESQG